MNDRSGHNATPQWTRAHIVDVLRKTGYEQAADEAARTLPEQVGPDELLRLSEEYGISRGELVNRMGGGP
jgi:hypothetical protein